MRDDWKECQRVPEEVWGGLMACPTTAVSWMMSVGLAWEWLEGNLGMRAAVAVAKVVERGRGYFRVLNLGF